MTIGLGSLAASATVQAQESVLIAPELPNDFDRGRNISVTQQSRPDYDPIGLRAGSFRIQPAISAGIGYTSNAFLSSSDADGDVYFETNPRLGISSDWSRHLLRATASGNLRRFASKTQRDENAFSLGTLGRLDFASDSSLTAEAQFARQYESTLSGEIDPDISQLSRYDRALFGVRGEHRAGRLRLLASFDHSPFRFDDVQLDGAAVIDQSFRNRDVDRLRGQAEYAFSPSLATYGQVTYDWTDYTAETLAVPGRDSTAIRAIAGFNFDYSGWMRGTLGAGYTHRDYRDATYADASGLSVESQIEFFVSELTTYKIGARRILADSSIGGSSAYFDNRLSFRVDHELRRNVLLNATLDFARQTYIGSDQANRVYRLIGGARFLANRNLKFDLNAAYMRRDQSGTVVPRDFDEFTTRVLAVWEF